MSESACAGADFIIFDRYIYDELANLPITRPAVRLYISLLLRLVPKPDLAYVVDADPEAAHRRKPEYPPEFVRKNRDSYITLSRLVQGMTVLAPLSVDETVAKIRESIAKKCLQADPEPVHFPLPCPRRPSEAKTSNI